MKRLIDDAVLAGISSAMKYPERLIIAGLPNRFESIIKNMEYSSTMQYDDLVEMMEQEAVKFEERNQANNMRKLDMANFWTNLHFHCSTS